MKDKGQMLYNSFFIKLKVMRFRNYPILKKIKKYNCAVFNVVGIIMGFTKLFELSNINL